VFIKVDGILGVAFLATATMLALSISAHSQQEVDPTWYNPWPEAAKTIAHQSQPVPAASGEKKKKLTAAVNSRKKNSRPREVRVQQRPNQVATTKSPSQQ
jgi:hypothetical protein